MTQYNMYEAKTKLSMICKKVENDEEDLIVLARNGVPCVKIVKYNPKDRSNFFGCAKGMYTVPSDFDDMDIISDFEGDIL